MINKICQWGALQRKLVNNLSFVWNSATTVMCLIILSLKYKALNFKIHCVLVNNFFANTFQKHSLLNKEKAIDSIQSTQQRKEYDVLYVWASNRTCYIVYI